MLKKRKADKLEKDLKWYNDDTSDRGLTTNQKLQLDLLAQFVNKPQVEAGNKNEWVSVHKSKQ